MDQTTTTSSFEVPFERVEANPDAYISAIFSYLESEFLVMPKGEGFVEYAAFEDAYESLKQASTNFTNITSAALRQVIFEKPLTMIVLRSMLGFTPPEWAYVATRHTDADVDQGFARSLDRDIRKNPLKALRGRPDRIEKIVALIDVACQFLTQGAPGVGPNQIHRLDKADTKLGADDVRARAAIGVPYAMLLYERFLGRPFAGHRDSVSGLIGDGLETAIEDVLSATGISYRKTKRAERIAGFDQAPDFIVPSEFNPHVVIEAKITEDDGTARDKVTRVQHLASLSLARQTAGQQGFEVVACIGGRGFGVRREDMRKLLFATRGKVFTLKTLDKLVDYTRLQEFRST